MDITRKLIDKILPTTSSAIDDFERGGDPFFEIIYDENGDASKIIFTKSIMNFFQLLLGGGRFESSILSEADPLTEQDYHRFLYYFLSDIKMSLLKEALISISKYFEVNSDKKLSMIKNELFYNFETLEAHIKQYVTSTNLAELDRILQFVKDQQTIIPFKIPKVVFPWYVYALCHTYKKLPTWDSGKKFKIIYAKHMSLMWTRSEYATEIPPIEKAQKNFQVYINFLKDNVNEHSNAYNSSLNLYLFNETTNLFDLYNIVKLFRNGSFYMFRMENGFETIVDNKERKERMEGIFGNVSHIAEINTFGVKTLLISKYYNKELFGDEKIWSTYNKIFTHTKSSLLNVIKQNQLPKFEAVADEIRLDYCVYNVLHKEEPYKEFLEAIFEEGLPIYLPSKNEIENHLFEAYSYNYKNFYKSRFKNVKKSRMEKY